MVRTQGKIPAPPGQPALLFALYGRTAARGKLVAQGSCRTWHIL